MSDEKVKLPPVNWIDSARGVPVTDAEIEQSLWDEYEKRGAISGKGICGPPKDELPPMLKTPRQPPLDPFTNCRSIKEVYERYRRLREVPRNQASRKYLFKQFTRAVRSRRGPRQKPRSGNPVPW